MEFKILKTKKQEMIAAIVFFVVWGYAIYRFGKMQAGKGSLASNMKAPGNIIK
jgi:hypothetical protein